MDLKAIPFAILVIVTLCSCNDVGKEISQRKTGAKSLFYNYFVTPQICTGCPIHYCDTDPGIILGYCCGCRRALDILPIYCPPNIFCPSSLQGICHDYEYMLRCCC